MLDDHQFFWEGTVSNCVFVYWTRNFKIKTYITITIHQLRRCFEEKPWLQRHHRHLVSCYVFIISLSSFFSLFYFWLLILFTKLSHDCWWSWGYQIYRGCQHLSEKMVYSLDEFILITVICLLHIIYQRHKIY